jgi:O-antigen ligase
VKVAAVPLVLIPALGAVDGGFHPGAWVWSAALAAWASALALVFSSDPGGLRRAWPWAAAAGALLLWTILSAVWSADPTQTVLEARRTLLYAAVVLALLLLARDQAPKALVPATHAAIGGLLVYALARYLLGARHFAEFEGYQLYRPLGYANAVGILAALGLLLGVGITAAPAARRPHRIAAAATIPLLALAVQLTGSTASWLALGVGLAVVVLLDAAPLRLLATLTTVALPAAAAIWVGWHSGRATLATPRLSGGATALAALVCAAAAALAVALPRVPEARHQGARTRRLVIAAVLVLALAGIAAAARAGATEPRSSYYHVAWHDQYVRHPLLGTGAGTFGLYWSRSGEALQQGGALDAHSLYLETLAELGPLGLLLVLVFLLAPLRNALRLRHAPYVPAALGAYAAFLVHAGLDWDWEMPAVVVAALCCAGAVATAGLRDERPLGTRTRAALLAAALTLGGFAIAGARSSAEPGALPERAKAPRSGAFSQTTV